MQNVSIIICTKDRSHLLSHCLKSISEAADLCSICEVLVINNNSTDLTSSVIEEYESIGTREIIEQREGLSFCRNTGASIAKGDWLFYLDDDGKIQKDTITQLIYTINNYSFIFIAGVFIAWDFYNTPKWFPKEWSTYLLKGSELIREIGEDYVSGNIMAIKKSVLIEVGGFPTHLGMNGNKIAYGEESYVETKLRILNKPIGINPFMVLHHIVGEHKLSLRWILKASFAMGRDGAYVHNKSLKDLPSIILNFLERLVKNFARSGIGIFSKKEYYWQNYLIDNLGPFLSYIGLISSIIKKSFSLSPQNDNLKP